MPIAPGLETEPSGQVPLQELVAETGCYRPALGVELEVVTDTSQESVQGGRSTVAVLERSWSKALATTGIGPDSDFFALGGDSLTALRIAGMVAAELEADDELEALVFEALFEEPTLGDVALLLDRHLREPESPAAGPAALGDPEVGIE